MLKQLFKIFKLKIYFSDIESSSTMTNSNNCSDNSDKEYDEQTNYYHNGYTDERAYCGYDNGFYDENPNYTSQFKDYDHKYTASGDFRENYYDEGYKSSDKVSHDDFSYTELKYENQCHTENENINEDYCYFKIEDAHKDKFRGLSDKNIETGHKTTRLV